MIAGTRRQSGRAERIKSLRRAESQTAILQPEPGRVDLRSATNSISVGSPGGLARPVAFMVMPLGVEDLQVVYDDFLKPVLELKCGFECVRADDTFGSDIVMNDILDAIQAAEIVVADLTGQNPNVFYEVGLAHAIGVPVLLLTQSLADVPFDLRHRRIQLYEYSPCGCKRLEGQIEKRLRQMLNRQIAL